MGRMDRKKNLEWNDKIFVQYVVSMQMIDFDNCDFYTTPLNHVK